jgi:indoleamine 2,3-dioxygenase
MSDEELDSFVQALPQEPDLDPTSTSPEEREGIIRAYVTLAAHLIHRQTFSSRRELPPGVARPLWDFSELVNRPPSLTYASYVLANFTTAVRGRIPADELKIAQTPTGTADEDWFIAVHLSVETAGGPIVDAGLVIEQALESGDESLLVGAMESIESSVVFATEVIPTIRERLSADVFVKTIRPLLYGHDQIRFRGVPGEPVVTYIGETGAQSGAIRAADAMLGTHHAEATHASMNRFLACAPPSHQRFCKRASGLGQRLTITAKSPSVRAARRSALNALANFRRVHFEVVAEYLMPLGKSVVSHGTGGTNFKAWLRQIVDESEKAVAEA